MEFREWITDLIMCVSTLNNVCVYNLASGDLKTLCRHKSAPVYNGKHLPYRLLATRDDVAKYRVFCDVTLYKLT